MSADRTRRAAEIERFLALFRRFGAAPSAAFYLALFDAEATLFDSGMPRPITVPEIPEHIEGILKLVPDFEMTPERWRFREPTLFVEAHNQASFGKELVEWPSVYCIDLRADRVIRGRRYYDRRPLFARLSPELAAKPAFSGGAPLAIDTLVADAATLARHCESRAAERASSFGIDGLALALATWAGDASLAFLEWTATGERSGQPLRFGVTDRYDLADGRVTASRAYFDSLALG
jgi:ketosteroid isomerase-like protein